MALASRGALQDALGAGAGGAQSRLPAAGRGLYKSGSGRNTGLFSRTVSHGRLLTSPPLIAASAAVSTERVAIAAKTPALGAKVRRPD